VPVLDAAAVIGSGSALGAPLLSGAAPEKRAERAMGAHLVRRGSGVILLLTPPFDHTAFDPGYIKGYIPGIRENGGQYTHAGAWVVLGVGGVTAVG